MSMASGWVRNSFGSAPAGSAGFGASAMGAGAGASSFLPHPARKVVDAAILVIATKRCRCMVALSLDGRVRGPENNGDRPHLLGNEQQGAAPILLIGHHGEDHPARPGRQAIFPAALRLPDPYVTSLFRFYVESQAAPLVDDLA